MQYSVAAPTSAFHFGSSVADLFQLMYLGCCVHLTATFEVVALFLLDHCLRVVAVFSKSMILATVQHQLLQYIPPARIGNFRTLDLDNGRRNITNHNNDMHLRCLAMANALSLLSHPTYVGCVRNHLLTTIGLMNHLDVVFKHRCTSRGEVMMTKGDSKINKKHGGAVGGQKICFCDSSVKYQCNEKLY